MQHARRLRIPPAIISRSGIARLGHGLTTTATPQPNPDITSLGHVRSSARSRSFCFATPQSSVVGCPDRAVAHQWRGGGRSSLSLHSLRCCEIQWSVSWQSSVRASIVELTTTALRWRYLHTLHLLRLELWRDQRTAVRRRSCFVPICWFVLTAAQYKRTALGTA